MIFRRTHSFAKLDLGRLHATLSRIGRTLGRTAAQVALAWLLHRPGHRGSDRPGAAGLRLEEAELREIEGAAP